MTRLFVAIVTAALAVLPAAYAIDGDATYTGNTLSGGTCSFSNYTFPAGLSGAGLGPSNWAGAGKCGACLQVTGPRGSVNVMIVDSCPSCKENRLNLFTDAFKQIANQNDGIIRVSYEPIACGIPAPLSVRNKNGSSKWFFSMQVLDCNYPITALDVSTDGANTWLPTVRREYNFFEKEKSGGFEKDTVLVRISCSNGKRVIIPNVSMAGDARTIAPVNC